MSKRHPSDRALRPATINTPGQDRIFQKIWAVPLASARSEWKKGNAWDFCRGFMGCWRTGKTTSEHEERKCFFFHIIHPDLRQSRGEITAKAGRDGCRDHWCVYAIQEFGCEFILSE
jgi:hypothetical protein